VIPYLLILVGAALFTAAANRHAQRRGGARPLAWAAVTCWAFAYFLTCAIAFGVVRA
jgi:hypothetical protein